MRPRVGTSRRSGGIHGRRPSSIRSGYARKQLPELLAEFSRGSSDSVFLGAHRKAVGVLLPIKVYDELRGERKQTVDDATGSLRAEGLEPSPVAAELSHLFTQARITAGQMEAMLLAYHRAA